MPHFFKHLCGNAQVLLPNGKWAHFLGGIYVVKDEDPDAEAIVESFKRNPLIVAHEEFDGQTEADEAKKEMLERSLPRPKKRIAKQLSSAAVVAPEESVENYPT